MLDTIPGINQDAAATILAEIGPDMSKFPSDAHLATWVGLCPTIYIQFIKLSYTVSMLMKILWIMGGTNI